MPIVMNISKNLKALIFAVISLALLGFVTYSYLPELTNKDYVTILLYLFLLVFVNSFPLRIGEIYVTFILAISMSVFLEYGIVVEAWLTQISILVSLLVSGQRRSIRRIISSQMMFVWMSLGAGFVFFLAGGKFGFTVLHINTQLIPIILYTLTMFVVNHLVLFFLLRYVEGIKVELLSDDMIWDGATLLLTLPLGVIMYLVKTTYGNYGMMFVAIPIIIVTHLFKIYNDLHQSHHQLKALNKITSSFTSELNIEKTVHSLQSAIRELLSFDYSYIFLAKGDHLQLISSTDYKGNIVANEELEKIKINFGDGLSGKVALYKKAEMVGNNADLFQLDIEPQFIADNKSLLSAPMLWNNQVIGVISLGSMEEYHFSKKDMTLIKILASQAAVAIQNATKYQKSEEKSMMDELTGVYNFRAFDELLRDKILEAEMREEDVSLLMIDLDHFKLINDTYGHDAGNVVLKEVASLLKDLTRKDDIIARYGGEEFTIIIPNSELKKATIIAERIRESIEKHGVKIKNSLKQNEEVVVYVTASIGIATYPKIASSAQELIRHADRAMYIGSKQAGRNKVSAYQS